jgi:hypothetical protein
MYRVLVCRCRQGHWRMLTSISAIHAVKSKDTGAPSGEEPTGMRKNKGILAALSIAAVAAVFAVPAGPAYADDNGNGDHVCNQYEICFRASSADDWDYNGNYMHSFYWSNWRHGQEYLWPDPYDPRIPPPIVLMDNANGFWNRDSTCDVKLWDYDASYGWYTYYDLYRGFRGDVGEYRNNGHSRC